MPVINKAVDAYIEKSADFAKPILIHLRKLVHSACPDVEEKIKWGFPFFDYKGPLCNMAAFKEHCSFGFWKVSLLNDEKGILAEKKQEAAGSLGRITSIKDLPSDKVIIEFIKQAKKINDDGIKAPAKPKPKETKEIVMPSYVTKLLAKNKKAKAAFDNFSPSHRKEYIQWFEEAKTEETRNKRLAQAMEWLDQGKPRNWKYMKK
ncbi:MAG: YdeI/OmpD-associated family protein [Bacteroidetes bacterium]|nr:YdeI/OmpD-associated family protein [Bacteroidota bacterium]MBS1932376.1 YdeI/OmpD-associated family protein [Bacteroidota bacterium]